MTQHTHTHTAQMFVMKHIYFSRSRSEKGALMPHAGTGTLIYHAGRLWLLTANSVLNKETSLDNFFVHFGYIDKTQHGDSLKASELIKPDKWHSLGIEVSIQSLQ